MVSVSTPFLTLLTLQSLLAIQAIRLPASGLFSGSGGSDHSEQHINGSPQSPPDGSVPVPECKDGMNAKTREALIEAVLAKAPKLAYNCYLAKKALSIIRRMPKGAHEVSSSGADDSPLGLSFLNAKQDDYNPQDFVGDAVKSWKENLKNVWDGSGSLEFAVSVLIIASLKD
ncbi:hypothetical protein Aduo_014472 [Ancylostoma duodenale]